MQPHSRRQAVGFAAEHDGRPAALKARRRRKPPHRRECLAKQGCLSRGEQGREIRRLGIREAGDDGDGVAAAGGQLHGLVLVRARRAGQRRGAEQ